MSARRDDRDRASESGPLEDAQAQAPSATQPPESPADEIAKLIAEKQELTNTLVRRQADFENYRKRVEKERQHDRHRGVEVLIEHILPVLDAFDRALAGQGDSAYVEYRKGFELIRRQLWETLAKQGLTRIEAMGQEFNPHVHHAIERVESAEHADGIVIGEMQPGYLFHDRVLRPAMVRVAIAPESKSAHASKHEN
ncbi:MAG TPA: nucleotide exchange factor GrpE [Candidatus Acidoferrales bacterium]|nr:nucleotide exchange factor GrpE [Candidatus Acidoferrales bacterium]